MGWLVLSTKVYFRKKKKKRNKKKLSAKYFTAVSAKNRTQMKDCFFNSLF